ncbi:quinone-dependent dihydroorotate dehydrogenase [Alkalilimnicola sp. S0819]|uniref:quinone-dependent dihydroorotate dehydrogenase n=1 Tax=Alkalilimnicola sp. S0819 TaxID=2613922 RepID=UPI001261E0A2|nr:quinone-dependent dihydroorotate dehydrogenase [Alkalilimnicola sp. S0819]KAB7622623.1 quinone-dependent dihydroorotate dehydrogenase [Alkalilimnicola sp. S0819]MPQ17394.1 quinone-dependent dihydroorotate dehydrogenase [Alkalilimnicola sp. S0819]
MYALLRPLLFRLEAEKAHHLTLTLLQRAAALGLIGGERPHLPCRVMGLDFPNPVGLAAGLDKNGEYITALARLGFGFIEIGTVTPRPQPGNPRPRLFRCPREQAVINRMGFNNKGVDYLVEQVRAARFQGVLGINIGKNFDTPVERAVDDYLIGLEKVYPHAGYVVVNVSSPNTPGLRDLQHGKLLDELLDRLREAQARLAQRHGRYVPLVMKIAPDMDAEQLADFAQRLRAYQVDGLAATNTTLSRDGVEQCAAAAEPGGLSGKPLLTRSTEVLRQLAQLLEGAVPLIGIGGIVDGSGAALKMRAGAQLVQLYSGLVYRGPALVRESVEAIRAAG